MQEKSSRNSASSQLEIEFIDKPVTPYGGMALLIEYFNGIGLKTLLDEALPDERTLPNATDVTDI
jgi:hypothetical protein